MNRLSAARLSSFRRTVSDAPVSYSVYSAFSYYGPHNGHELPGSWLVPALRELGHGTAAIRQTLYRMEGSQELDSRVEGRTKFYSLTAAARAESLAGLEMIFGSDEGAWDGEWTLVQFAPGSEHRLERERLRELLNSEGFSAIGAGLFAHPRDRSARPIEAARGHEALDLVEVYRARRLLGDDRAFVDRHWDIDGLDRQYSRFLQRFEPLRERAPSLAAPAAFVLRFALVFDFLEIAWRDPALPTDLLPPNWVGSRARELASWLYSALLPAAVAHADDIRSRMRR